MKWMEDLFNMPAKFRILSKRFWTDPRTRDLTANQKLLFAYAITGPEACTNTHSSGIYEIHRSSFENMIGFSYHETDEILKFFNEKRPELLEYDAVEHMIYVKSFFKHNASYKPDVVRSVMDDFNETFDRAPMFWADFGIRYRERLGKIYPVLMDRDQVKFLDRLFELKNEDLIPSSTVRSLSINSLKSKKSLSPC